MKKSVSIFTFGCKLNQYESQAMAERLGKYEIFFSRDKADIFILNSCTVTSQAERKLRQLFRHLRSLNPEAKIMVVGCYSQLSGEELIRLGANEALGVKEKLDIEKYVAKLLGERHNDSNDSRDEFLTVSSSLENRTRAFLAIEDGCLNECAYCRIRLARGNKIISKPLKVIKEEFQKLVENGFKEVVLTGLNIGYYGFETGTSLVELLRELEKLPGDWRLRLGSLDPDRVNRDLLKLLSETDKVARHLHLSLQSGSNRVLEAMKRKYTLEQYLEAIDRARAIDCRFSFTTDVIAGFPSESDSDFYKTVEVIKRVVFLKVHVFRYSNRPGTQAAKMNHHVRANLKKERAVALSEVASESRREYLLRHIGRTNNVLVEKRDGSCSRGYDEYYIPHSVVGEHEGFVKSTVMSLESHKEGSDAELYCRSMAR